MMRPPDRGAGEDPAARKPGRQHPETKRVVITAVPEDIEVRACCVSNRLKFPCGQAPWRRAAV